LGMTHIWREAFYSSMEIAKETLSQLGFSSKDVNDTVKKFQDHDERRLQLHYAVYQDQEKLMEMARQAVKELEELFEEDVALEAEDDKTHQNRKTRRSSQN